MRARTPSAVLSAEYAVSPPSRKPARQQSRRSPAASRLAFDALRPILRLLVASGLNLPEILSLARKALRRKTGARGLRSILEHILLDIMFELPNMQNVQKVVVEENAVVGDGKPLIIYGDSPKVAGSN